MEIRMNYLVPFIYFALPIAAIVALKYSSIRGLRKAAWIPYIMLVLMTILALIDNRCEGDGLKLSWINCSPEFFSDYANDIAGILFFNLLLVMLLIPLLAVLALIELFRWKTRQNGNE